MCWIRRFLAEEWLTTEDFGRARSYNLWDSEATYGVH